MAIVFSARNLRVPNRIDRKACAGIPVVCDTSFNENEPVVCKPEEGLDYFLRTRMDDLIMSKYHVECTRTE